MRIETITMGVFLHRLYSDSDIFIGMNYQLSGMGGGNCHLGSLKKSKEEISKRIREDLEDISKGITRLVTEITFHNGSKKDVIEYNGHNDEVLRNPLPIDYYQKIIFLLKSQPPNMSYKPPILG